MMMAAMKGMCMVTVVAFMAVVMTEAATCPLKTSSGRSLKECMTLPSLGATLSYTFSKDDGAVEVMYKAKPPTKEGWVAWGINPTATGMAGSQALLAYLSSKGAAVVHTYDLTNTKGPFKPAKISIDVSDLAAEYDSASGVFTITANVTLPSKRSSVVHHVWQVGPAMSDDSPAPHEFKPANFMSNRTLDFSMSAASAATPASSPTTPTSSNSSSASPKASSAATPASSASTPTSSNSSSASPKASSTWRLFYTPKSLAVSLLVSAVAVSFFS